MSAHKATRILAGTFLLASIALATWVDVRWLFLTAFVGLNLTQFALSDFCPAVLIFKQVGLRVEKPTRAITVSRGAGGMVGLIVLFALIAYLLTGQTTVPFTVIAVVAISFAQSAFTDWCPALLIMRRLRRPQPGLM